MALVPPAVVTVMSTVPLPAGDVAVICVALLTVNELALPAPNFTAVAPVKLVPVMVTLVPPAVAAGVGADRRHRRGRYLIGELIGGAGGTGAARVVTVMSTVPLPAGVVAVI